MEIEPYYCLPVGSLMSNGQTNLTSKHGGSVGAAASVAWSQPTSPSPVNRQQQQQQQLQNGPMSPTGGQGVSQKLVYASMMPSSTGAKKNDDGEWREREKVEKEVKFNWILWFLLNPPAHGSSASLLSGASALYANTEDRSSYEIRRLKKELIDAREQVLSLSSKLSTNVSMGRFIEGETRGGSKLKLWATVW